MNKHVFAHTEAGCSYPGYISVSRNEDGSFSFTVRSQGHNGERQGTYSISWKDAVLLSGAINSAIVGPIDD